MQILLNGDVKNLGYRGDILNVKNGYFRNFLFPKGLAQVANAKVIKLAEARSEKSTLQKERVIENAKDVLKKLKGLSVTIKAKVSDKGKLYGSITEADVVEAVKEGAKVELEKDFIKMDHFRDLGEHKAKVYLGEGLEEEITVVLEAQE
ncbi:MAG: 50S ribosomal protein L9 [Nitrospirae bacterium]|nr:50S ribosomal protein L9 [Nitrospirota bacterium]